MTFHFGIFSKVKIGSSIRRLDRMRVQQEKFLRHQFLLFTRLATNKQTMAEVTKLIEAKNFKGIEKLIEGIIDRLGNALSVSFIDVAQQESVNMSKLVKPVPVTKQVELEAWSSISFNPTDPKIVALMRSAKLEFVQQMTRQQKRVIARALADGVQRGVGAAELARIYRGSIGLTEHQWRAVQNYQRLLEQSSPQALDRELRDRRFDGTLETAIEENSPLSAKQIERMVGRYTERFISMRAETIARTETMRVMEDARQAATEQIMDEAGIERDWVVKEWIATHDNRTRDTHAELDGTRVFLDDEFTINGASAMHPGAFGDPGLDINCRCSVLYHTFSSREEAQAFIDEVNKRSRGNVIRYKAGTHRHTPRCSHSIFG